MAHLLSKQGESITDGELFESCSITAAEEGCPENINLFKIISLSAIIVT